jgi:hypothetical protein
MHERELNKHESSGIKKTNKSYLHHNPTFFPAETSKNLKEATSELEIVPELISTKSPCSLSKEAVPKLETLMKAFQLPTSQEGPKLQRQTQIFPKSSRSTQA